MQQRFAYAMRRARVFGFAVLLLGALPARAQSSTPAPVSSASPVMHEVVDEAGRPAAPPYIAFSAQPFETEVACAR